MLENLFALGKLAPVVVLGTFFANVFLAAIVYRNNPKSWTNRFLTLLSLVFAGWTIFNFLALLPGTEETRLFFVRLVMFVTAFMGVFTYLLAVTFPAEKLLLEKTAFFAVVFAAIIVAGLGLSPWMFSSLKNTANGGFNLNPGPALALFGLSHIGFTTAGFVILIKKLHLSVGRARQQLYWFLWGIILTLSLITVSNFLVIIFLDSIQYTFIGPTFTLFQAGFITYAIVKHRFLDIRLLVARSIAYSLLGVTLGIMYVAGLFFVSYFITKENSALNSINIVSSTVLALLIALSFQPLRYWFEAVTDKILHQEHYDAESLLQHLSKSMATSISLKDISSDVLRIIKENLRLTKIGLIIVHKKHLHRYTRNHKQKNQHYRLTKREINFLKSKPLLLFDELVESKVKEILRKYHIFAIVPLKTRKHFIGFLALGEKASGDTFFTYDVRLLKIIGPELAIALQNAQRFEEIQQFNQTLQRKIKQATSNLRHVNSRLKELDKLKDEFLSVAAHELRTPLGSIRWNLEMALGGQTGKINKQTQTIISQSYDSARRLIRLINNLLNVSRIEQKRVKDEPELTNIIKIIRTTVQELYGLTREKKLKVFLNVSKDKKIPIIKIDPRRFQETIVNLLSNAIKYSKEKGKITINVGVVKKNIVIEVSDYGIGIPQKDQVNIFSKFFRADNANESGEEGSGLGLFVVKSYVESWGGSIAFKSELNQGTTFTLNLPFKPTHHVLDKNLKKIPHKIKI